MRSKGMERQGIRRSIITYLAKGALLILLQTHKYQTSGFIHKFRSRKHACYTVSNAEKDIECSESSWALFTVSTACESA